MTLSLRLISVASSDTVAARSDPDAQPLTAKQLKSMLPINALLVVSTWRVTPVHEDGSVPFLTGPPQVPTDR